MKILKNIFGSKPKQNTKYEPNTLAEMNGSPDLRLATAKEKEVDIPLHKTEEVKKISKSSTKSSAQKSTASASNGASPKKATPTATKTTANKQVSSTNKSTQKKTSASTAVAKKETTVKKTSETKKATSAAAKKPEAKAASSKVEKKPVAEAKKEVKAASAAKKATTAKKETTKEVKKPVSTEAKKPATTKAKASLQPEKKETKKPVAAKAAPQKDAETITESKTTRSGKFEIKKSKDGRFVFNLYASNNVIVATSQVYSSSTSAVNGIKSVVANAASAQIEDQSLKKVTPVPFPKWEIYQDKGEQYRFRLCASNGSCVVHSQGYTSKANCKKGIESIIKFASDAEITKVYLDKKDK